MKLRRPCATSAVGWILLLVTVLLAVVVAYGVPIRFPLNPAELRYEPKNAYRVPLPELGWPLFVVSDGRRASRSSLTEVLEDDRPLGPAHAFAVSITRLGGGRYSHWGGKLLFSTSDNSDPRTNDRRYVVVLRVQLAPEILLVWLNCLGFAAAAVFFIWLRRGLIDRSDFLLAIGLWAAAALLFAAVPRAQGMGLWLLLGVGTGSLVWAAAVSRGTAAKVAGRSWTGWQAVANATLLVASLTVALTGVEALLTAWEHRATGLGRIEHALEAFGVEVPGKVVRAATRRRALITFPAEFERVSIEVEGAVNAFRWHGVEHLKDSNNMRRATPFPARKAHVFRVMVVGDSFTIGHGIDERWTYSRQLENLLEPDHEVEVLNLGVSGHQSEDVLREVREFLPRLRPDLVVYGVCVNDFLPSDLRQSRRNFAYAVPLPESLKTFFTTRSRLVRLSEDAYNQALLKMGLRADLFDNILDGFSGYQQRFARDVANMNELVTDNGLPPVVALGLDQHPVVGSRGYRIVQAAEEHLESAGIDVIETAPYYQHFAGSNFKVSRWEAHGNEVANAIWATMLNRHLRELAVLRPFRKTGAGR